MAGRRTYHVQVTREAGWWMLYVPEIDRTTQARHPDEVDVMARDLIAIMTATEPDSFDLVEVGVTRVPPGFLETLTD